MSDHDFFPIAAAINELVEATGRHDTERMIRAARYLDMSPAILLRGMAFLSECLNANENAPPMQAKLARSAINEVTALCAVLLEVENNAALHRATEG